MNPENLEDLIKVIKEECPTNKVMFKYGVDKIEIHSLDAIKIKDGLLRYVNINDGTIRYIDIGSIYEIIVNKD